MIAPPGMARLALPPRNRHPTLDPTRGTPFNSGMFVAIAVIIGAYLVGSVASAILVCRAMGLPDPRQEGSRNPGATNVLRVGTRTAAGLTLAGDFLKGWLPVAIAVALGTPAPVVAAAGLAAFLGHVFPVFFGFHGGKGVATGLGVLLGWSWLALLAAALTWVAVAAAFRYSSLAALVAFLLAPIYLLGLGEPPLVIAAMAVVTALTFWRHQGNIRNLRQGTEKRIGEKAGSA